VVDNRSTSYAVPGRIAERFATEGWHVATVDGRDDGELERALKDRPTGVPNVVVATVVPEEELAA
jgi:transketolase